jgi:hypothetical protein
MRTKLVWLLESKSPWKTTLLLLCASESWVKVAYHEVCLGRWVPRTSVLNIQTLCMPVSNLKTMRARKFEWWMRSKKQNHHKKGLWEQSWVNGLKILSGIVDTGHKRPLRHTGCYRRLKKGRVFQSHSFGKSTHRIFQLWRHAGGPYGPYCCWICRVVPREDSWGTGSGRKWQDMRSLDRLTTKSHKFAKASSFAHCYFIGNRWCNLHHVFATDVNYSCFLNAQEAGRRQLETQVGPQHGQEKFKIKKIF